MAEDSPVLPFPAERDLTRSGVTVDFMGEKANMAAGPAQRALETGAALHVVHSWFAGEGWGLSVSPELEVTDLQTTNAPRAGRRQSLGQAVRDRRPYWPFPP